MHILKKIIRGLCAYGFRASLFGLGLGLGFVLTFSSSDPLKSALQGSGIYETPLTKLIDFSEQTDIESKTDTTELSINDPLVQDAIETALPEEKKKEIVESVLDGTYVWLHGNAEYPDFFIDLSPEKALLIQTLADNVYARIETLPPCTLEQLQALNQEFDAFSINCQPPVNLAAEKQKFIDEYSNNQDFLNDPTLSGEELLKETERHDSSNNAQNVPEAFGLFMKLPYIFAVSALITLLGVLFLADTKYKGLHKIGKLFVETAISLAIVGTGLYFILGGVKASIGSQVTPELQSAISRIFDTLRGDIMLPGLILTILYLIIGIALLVFTHKKRSEKESVLTEDLREAKSTPNEQDKNTQTSEQQRTSLEKDQ